MKNIIRTAFIVLLFPIIFIGKANAAVLDSKFIENRVKEDLTGQISKLVKGEVKVEVNIIPFKTIKVPDGKITIVTSTNLHYFSPLAVAKVDILVNGEKVKTFGSSVRVYVYDKVWVAADAIDRGSAFSGENMILERKELGLLTETAARENRYLYNCMAKKNFKPGDIIDTRYIETAPLVLKNSPVSVIFNSSEVTITIPAEALNDGKMGDYIKVRSKQYKKEYMGKVIDANTVLVNI